MSPKRPLLETVLAAARDFSNLSACRSRSDDFEVSNELVKFVIGQATELRFYLLNLPGRCLASAGCRARYAEGVTPAPLFPYSASGREWRRSSCNSIGPSGKWATGHGGAEHSHGLS
jgi:hypothetical protein